MRASRGRHAVVLGPQRSSTARRARRRGSVTRARRHGDRLPSRLALARSAPHVRDRPGRAPLLLGSQRRGTARRQRRERAEHSDPGRSGDVQHGRRGRFPHMRDPHGRSAPLLGVEPVRSARARCDCRSGPGHPSHASGHRWRLDARVAGKDHTCGIRAGELWCWGSGADYQTGLDRSDAFTSPERVGTSGLWEAVSAGRFHTCGRAGPATFCWGQNMVGEVDGAPSASVRVPTTRASYVAIVASIGSFTCATNDAMELWCWGENTSGQLGIGTMTPSSPEMPVRW